MRNFNWHYRADHAFARSHVADQRTEHYATFTNQPCDLDEPMPRAKPTHAMTDAEWEATQR